MREEFSAEEQISIALDAVATSDQVLLRALIGFELDEALRGREGADEVRGKAWENAFVRAKQYKGDGPFGAWTGKIVDNALIDRERDRGAGERKRGGPEPRPTPGPREQLELEEDAEELARLTQEWVDRLVERLTDLHVERSRELLPVLELSLAAREDGRLEKWKAFTNFLRAGGFTRDGLRPYPYHAERHLRDILHLAAGEPCDYLGKDLWRFYRAFLLRLTDDMALHLAQALDS